MKNYLEQFDPIIFQPYSISDPTSQNRLDLHMLFPYRILPTTAAHKTVMLALDDPNRGKRRSQINDHIPQLGKLIDPLFELANNEARNTLILSSTSIQVQNLPDLSNESFLPYVRFANSVDQRLHSLRAALIGRASISVSAPRQLVPADCR